MLYRIKEGFVLLAMTALVAGLIWAMIVFVPQRHNPLKPLDLTEPLGMATYLKLTFLKKDPQLCRQRLDEAGVSYRSLAADEPGGRCSLGETLLLQKSLTPYSAAPLRMTCHQMAALYLWERHIVRVKAQEIFSSPLRQIRTYGSFSCRNIAGTQTRSQHSFANAIDISGFVLEDGTQISVRQHWREKSDKGRFLKAVHAGACDLFSVTLGPDYNAAHADHFHLDMGSTETCR